MTINHGVAAVAAADAVVAAVCAASASESGPRLRLVDAPAGAGKTGLVTRLIPGHVERDRRVAIVTQTNAQADDLAVRLAKQEPTLAVTRFIRDGYEFVSALPNIVITADAHAAATGTVVIANSSKWAYAPQAGRFDVAIIDEAYQMPGGSLLYIGDRFDRIEMVGDPGQLSPFTSVDTDRWTGLSADPVRNAVDTVRQYHEIETRTLPVTRRLPAHAADLVREAFYPDLSFSAATELGARQLGAASGDSTFPDRVIDTALAEGWALGLLPARLVQRNDRQLADAAAHLAQRLLQRGTFRIQDEHSALPLTITADRLAIGASHRDQVAAVHAALRERGVEGVVVDTANRLQGREFDVVIAWHPLSGQVESSAFHLDVGRLCVLTTRHRHCCIVLARAGIGEVLESSVPIGEGILGEPNDRSISGWEAHLLMLDRLSEFSVVL